MKRAPGTPSATEAPRVGELERIGIDGREAMVIGVEATGFDDLTPREKRFAYWMYRAAIPGNAIAFDQGHRHSPLLVRVLEGCFAQADGLDPALRAALHEYLKLVWIHHGPYHHLTHAKFLPPRLTPEMLRAAIAHARQRGGLTESEQDIAPLFPLVFDPDFEPIQTNQSAGVDIVATSAVNYYDPGITRAEIDALGAEWTERINVRFAKRDGRVKPEVYRIGGVYSRHLETISHFIRLALPDAESSEQREALESLLAYYATGDEAHFRAHMVHWLKSDARVDYLNGFIESYMDPRATIGQFAGNTSFRAGGGLIEKIADQAPYFEARMPWPDIYKRTDVSRPVASVVNVLIETGDSGPVSPAAYNLPNYNDIRRDHGSKNVILHNVENTRSEALERLVVDEFFLPEYREATLALTFPLIRPLKVYLHEVIGHGSGRPDPALASDPRASLGRVYSALEEARADLVALYHIGDPRLAEMGAYAASMRDTVVETAYVGYLQGWMSRMDRVDGHEVREAHDRGHHLILMWLLRGGSDGRDYGVRVVNVGGDFFVRVDDTGRMRSGVGELLGRLQVIKATGDAAAAHHIFDEFGTALDPAWKTNIVARRAKLNIPSLKAFVFPHLRAVVRNGAIENVTLSHDEDLTAQMLRYRRLELSRRLEDD